MNLALVSYVIDWRGNAHPEEILAFIGIAFLLFAPLANPVMARMHEARYARNDLKKRDRRRTRREAELMGAYQK